MFRHHSDPTRRMYLHHFRFLAFPPDSIRLFPSLANLCFALAEGVAAVPDGRDGRNASDVEVVVDLGKSAPIEDAVGFAARAEASAGPMHHLRSLETNVQWHFSSDDVYCSIRYPQSSSSCNRVVLLLLVLNLV